MDRRRCFFGVGVFYGHSGADCKGKADASRAPLSEDAKIDSGLQRVHLLVSEEFFSDKVGEALRACGKTPHTPDWGDEDAVFEAIASAEGGAGVVVNLEDECADMLSLLGRMRKDPRTKKLPILGFCGDLEGDCALAANKLNIRVVARSALARNLVQMVMELVPSAA